MKQKESAEKHFSEGKNCAQSVLLSFANELNFNQTQALNLTSGFGGGLAHNGKVCGAVSGAIMVLGLKYGSTGKTPAESKEITFRKVNEFITKFKQEFGSLDCKDLIDGIDLMTEEGRAESKKRNTHDNICSPIVAKAAEIILEIN